LVLEFQTIARPMRQTRDGLNLKLRRLISG
jgi:hypothetical protein